MIDLAPAIIKHRLFSVRLVIARSIAYTLLLASLAALYAAGLFSVSHYLFPDSTSSQNIAYIILAILLAFTFQPLRRFFEHQTDRIFYRDRYDSEQVLRELGTAIAMEIELGKMLKATLTTLTKNMRIESAQLMVYDEKGGLAGIEHIGPMPERIVTPHILTKVDDRAVLVADDVADLKLRDQLTSRGVRVVVQLRTKGRRVGYLLLGDKLSGDIYSSQDLDLLEIFSQELAVAVINALAYQEIAEFNLTLQQKVESATRKLKAANQHLEELDHTKDEFLSLASHQLRTPLTSVKGFLSMLADGDVGPVTPQQQQLIGYAYDSSQRMVGMISDLLNVSRMSAGRFMIERAPTDLAKVIQEEAHQLQLSAHNKRINLVIDLPARPVPLAMLDEGKTRQVVMNFMDNAIYYTDDKGKVTVRLRRIPGDKLRFEVIDNGMGVPPEQQKQLFHKFYRADNAKKARPDGTGLGLFLAKQVIEQQDGTILFKSQEGKGSLFGFEIPIKGADHEIHL